MVGRRRELETIKAFMTRRVDNFRPPYGRCNVKRPRCCMLAGTTNADDWVRDNTGARRFWPIRCGEIEIELLIQHRDQLWAEAVALYRLGPDEGGAWWFTDKSLIADARNEAEARRPPDPWAPRVLEHIATRQATTGEEVLTQCLGVKAADQDTAQLMRVANRGGGRSKFGSEGKSGSHPAINLIPTEQAGGWYEIRVVPQRFEPAYQPYEPFTRAHVRAPTYPCIVEPRN